MSKMDPAQEMFEIEIRTIDDVQYYVVKDKASGDELFLTSSIAVVSKIAMSMYTISMLKTLIDAY